MLVKLLFFSSFYTPGSGSGSTDPNESGSTSLLICVQCSASSYAQGAPDTRPITIFVAGAASGGEPGLFGPGVRPVPGLPGQFPVFRLPRREV